MKHTAVKKNNLRIDKSCEFILKQRIVDQNAFQFRNCTCSPAHKMRALHDSKVISAQCFQ